MMRALAFASVLVTALCASALQAQPFQPFDSTGAVSQEGRDVAMPLSALAPAFEGARDRAADPRVREWVALVEEGAHAALIASAEADLAGEEPHPYASHVWCWAQWASGALFAGRMPEMPEALRPVLEPAARAFVNDRLKRKEDMPALVPALIETADRNYWALIHALWAIRDMDAAEFRLPLAQVLLAAYPDDFNVAMTVGWSGGPQRNEMAAWLDANPAVDAAPAGRLVRWRLQNRGWTLAERIWLSETWLEHAPNDFQALRRLGYALEDQGRQDEAAEALDRANRIYPLMSDSGVRPARVLAAAGKLDEAAARAVLHVERDTPPERQAAETARRRVEAFRHAGEHGRAREAALAGLEAAPEDEALILGVTDALIKEDFGDEAIRLLEDFRKERPLSFVATKRLASQYLGWQRNADAAALVESYHAAGGRLDGPLFDAWRRGLDAEDRHDEAAALLSLGREEVPDQHWTLGNISWSLSQVGRYDEAFELLRDLTREEPTAWTVRRMMEFGERAGRGDEASAALDRLARSYPQDSGVWQAVAKRDGIDAWELAAGRAPRRSFPIIEAGKAISGEDHRNWREGAAQMSAGLEALKAADAEPGHVRKVHAARAKLIDDAFVSGAHRSAEAMREALADLDAARALGMPEKDYWPERRRMLRRFGDSVELSEAALRAVWFNPDNSTGIGELTDKDIAEHLMSGSVAFTALDRRLRRQPRNPGALKNAMQYHNKYGGSPVVSLALAERFDRWNPAQSYGDLKAEAYGDLGLSQRLFEARYSRDDSISPSDRYVGWFEKAREKALDEQPVIKEIDLEAMRVTLIRPDGLIEERGYHPVLGRLIYYRLGAAEMEIEYHPDSALKAIRIGKERWVELGYNEAPIPGLKRKVTSLRGSGRPEITFRYGAHGKPVRIAIAGRGHMNVSYDDDGEIRETEAVLDDPDEPGSKLALEVTKAFQELLSLSRLAGDAASLDFDAIPYKDPEIAALQVEVAEQDDYLGGHGARLALARKLVEKVAEHPDHRRNAEEGLLALYYDALDLPEGEAAPAERIVAGAIEAVRLYRTLLMRTRPEGVPRWVWRDWVEMRDWALAQDETAPAIAGQAAAFRAELAQEAPRLLSQAGWLRESPLSNPGFWRRHPDHEMLPQVIADQTVLSDVLVRANGDVVAGSGNGLLVLRRGFWEWFGFDRSTARFSRNADPAALDAASNVLALHEDGDHDRLWLGLRNGLARLGADYELKPQLWRAGEDGLIAGGVVTLAESGSTLAAGGDGGVSFVDLGTNEISLVSEAPTARLRAAAGGFLSMERDGLWHLTATARTRLSDFQVTDAYWDGDEGWLYALQGDVLLRARWEGEGETERGFAPVPGQEAIAATAPPYALGSLPALKGERPLAVFTDQGVSLLRDGAFEHLAVPGSTRPVPFRTAADRDGRVAILTDAGVAMIESGQARVVSRNRVHDLLSDPAQGVTFAAFGDRIEVVEHDNPTESHWFSDANARRLAPMPDGSILTHDGSKVVRIEAGTGTIVELFSAAQTTPDGTRRFLVGSLLAASNGDIWAVAGASLFRWREGMEEAEEFSIYQDNPDFRPDSDMLSRVVETLDGRILLVASNEGHRNWRGDRMDGGLYEMRDGKLELVEVDNVGDWFLTSYTPIDAETAIFGTTAGFGRDRGGEFEPYDGLDDASYMALKKDRPGLYLGTDGAKLGEDLWLFGTGSGLVGYRGGVWFDPDRLNWMLPGQEYANYGARAVHAVAADPQGRVYIGTDFGLTVYDPLGAGPESFLISQGRGDFAFSAFERNRMQEVNEILLDAAMEDPKTAKLVERLRSSRKQLEELEESVAAAPLEDTDPVTLKRLRQQALRARQRDASLLLRLERDNPQMFRLLELNPLDLQAVGRSLPDGAVVAQYLPTDRTLYINIVSNRGAEIREVAVPGEALEEAARTVHALLAAQARGVKRGFDLSAPAKPAAEAAAPDLLTERLAWLYEQLLRPVESALPEDGTLIVSPSGALSYVPFAALVRETGGERPVYAAETMTLTTAPSLYAVERMVDAVSYMGGIHAVFGDPDGTLPAARQEAEEIAAALEPDLVELRIGEAATYDELVTSAEGARFVHLAMHGRLDPASPRNSYLLLAEGRRMQLPQIMTLPLAEADLVFLSACETGLGADGLEYRTIAHAFAHAGAPAVVATLWQVDDQATRELALAFYGAKLEGMENAEALIHAQRSLLDAGGANAAPGLWAGFTLLGKP